jgi:hypothetical protein
MVGEVVYPNLGTVVEAENWTDFYVSNFSTLFSKDSILFASVCTVLS